MPESTYEIDILFTLNEASARRAAEEARRIFNSGGEWGPNFGGGGGGGGGGQGGGGGGGGGGGAAAGAASGGSGPRDPADGSWARWQRLEQELGASAWELRQLSRAAGDFAAAMRAAAQAANNYRYGNVTNEQAARRGFEGAEQASGRFEGSWQARQEGPYAGNGYQSAYESSRFSSARSENLNYARSAQGALDAETQYSIGLNKASNERRRAFEELAKAQYDQTSPVQLSEETRSRINAFDDTILPGAERKAQKASQEKARQEQLGRLDSFLESDAPNAKKLTASLRGRAPGEAKLPGTGGGFWEGFSGGEGNFTKVIGQAARFGVVYGAIYSLMGAVTGGFSAAAKGAAQYEEALISLNLATNQTTEENRALADQASRIGTALGFGAPEGVQAASRAIGLYDLNAPGTTEQDRNQLSLQSTQVAGRIARVSGQDLEQVQTQVAGLVRSFNLSPFEQTRVEDQLSVISRQSGRNPADLLSAGTQIGQIAHTAGFDLPDTLSIISQVSSQTGQTADAVAGQLSQVLSKANDPTAMQRLTGVGVNVQGTTLKQQIEQLSALKLDPASRTQVVQAFGRSRSGASFDILLQNLGRIQGLAAEGRSAAPGTGERTFDTVMGALSKQLLELKGSLQNIANGLAQAGIFQAVGHLVVALGAMAKIVEHVVQVYDSLPGPIREGIATIVELMVAFRLLRFVIEAELVQKAVGGVSGLLNGKMLGGLTSAWRSSAGTGGAAEMFGGMFGGKFGKAGGFLGRDVGSFFGRGTERVVGVTASNLPKVGTDLVPYVAGARGLAVSEGAAGAAGAGGAAAGLLGPAAIAAAVIMTGVGMYHADEASRHTQSLQQQANAAGLSAGTSDEMRAAAGRYDQAVGAAQKQQELSFSNFLDQGLAPWLLRLEGSGSNAAKVEKSGQDRSADLRQQADELEKAHASAVTFSGSNAFQNFASADAVNNGLQVLTERGYSASQQLVALNQAMDGLITSSTTAGGAVGFIQQGAGKEFTVAAGSAGGKAIGSLRQKLDNDVKGLDPGRDMGPWDSFWHNWSQGTLGPRGDRKNAEFDRAAGLADTSAADRDILDNVDSKAFTAESQKRIGDYLKSRHKDATNGPVALTADEIKHLKSIEGDLVTKYAPGISKDSRNFLGGYLEKDFNEATGSFINTKASLTDVTSYLGGAVPLAEQSAQDAADIGRDPSIKPQIQLKNLEESRRKALALVATMPTTNAEEIKEKADALNAVNTKLDAAIARTYDEQTKARSDVIDRQVAGAQSLLMIEDTIGRRREEIKGLQEKLAGPNLSAIDRQNYQTQLNNARAQQAQEERQGTRATRLGEIQLNGYTAGGSYAAPDENLANAQADVDRLKALPDSDQAKGEALQKLAEAAKAEKEYADAVNLSTKKLALAPRDTVGAAKVDLDEATRVYNEAAKSGDRKAMGEAALDVRAKQEAYRQLVESVAVSNRRLAVAPNDAVGLAKLDVEEAKRVQQEAIRTGDTDAAAKAALDVRAKQAAQVQAIQQRDSTQRQVDTPQHSVLGDVKNRLDDAAQILHDAQTQGVGDVLQAQAGYNKALYDFASAQLDLAQQLSRNYDYTDPVQAGQKALKDIQDRLNAKDAKGNYLEADPNRRALLQKDADHQRISNEKTAFEQRQKDISDYEQLGRITHADALQMRKNDRARLAAEIASMKNTDEGYRQKQDELTELDKNIKSATDQFQGQFNIGGIKLPTVYEIRRSLGVTDGANTSAVNNYSTAANVTINGADFAKVVHYINSILGKPTRNVRANSTRVVG